MAISPPGDVVLDVMRAAEPEKVKAAREQLLKIAQGVAAPVAFASSLNASAGRGEIKPEQTAYHQFEAMVLGTFFQNVLPDEADSVYGGGLSGDMWKSILAQQLGDVVAARGGIGIANRLLADTYREGDRSVPLSGAADPNTHAAVDAQNRLSQALVQELQRKATHSLLAPADAGADGA